MSAWPVSTVHCGRGAHGAHEVENRCQTTGYTESDNGKFAANAQVRGPPSASTRRTGRLVRRTPLNCGFAVQRGPRSAPIPQELDAVGPEFPCSGPVMTDCRSRSTLGSAPLGRRGRPGSTRARRLTLSSGVLEASVRQCLTMAAYLLHRLVAERWSCAAACARLPRHRRQSARSQRPAGIRSTPRNLRELERPE